MERTWHTPECNGQDHIKRCIGYGQKEESIYKINIEVYGLNTVLSINTFIIKIM